jgi:PPOX class probable F420-dependent enzyme
VIVPEQLLDILNKRSFWHIATLGPAGTPQTSPVWATFDGTYVKFGLIAGCQKHKNVLTNPELSMSAVDPEDSYRYLEVRGHVVSIEDGSDMAFLNAMTLKYMDLDEYPYLQPGQVPVVVSVEPTHTTGSG